MIQFNYKIIGGEIMDNEILDLLKTLNNKLDRLDDKVKTIDNKLDDQVKTINDKLDEHTLILRALEHSSEVHKAEMDNLSHAVARVEGEVKGIREDLNAVEMITSKNWNDISKLKAVK